MSYFGLCPYLNFPVNIGTVIYADDTYTSDGITTTYTLVNKNALQLANTIQAGAIQYYFYNGGFTKNTTNNTFTLSSAPPLGTVITAPGIGSLVLSGFDASAVTGVASPQQDLVPFYLYADDIGLFSYAGIPGATGVEVDFVDLDPSNGATLAWVQLACSAVDGTALAYAGSGNPLWTTDFSVVGQVASAMWAGTTTIICNTASSFSYVNGDYLTLNWGGSSQEVVQLTNVAQPVLTISGTNFPHYIGETIYDSGRKFWSQLNVPLGATGGIPATFYNIGLNIQAIKVSRA